MNVLKSTSSSYVQNMIKNMILTSYLDESYFVTSWGGYVRSIQMMLRDKLKHQVRGQLLSRDITFVLHRWLRYTMTARQVNAAKGVFLVWPPVKYCYMLHHFFCIRRVYYKTLIPLKPMSYYILNIKMMSQWLSNFTELVACGS